MTTGAPPPGQLPAMDQSIEVRAFSDIWLQIRVTSMDGSYVDGVDDEGGVWSAPVELRGDAWRFLTDPDDPLAERRALVNLCMLSGTRRERARVLNIVRAGSVDGVSWIDSPATVIKVIESGETVETGEPSGDIGGGRAC